jgi:hypothetical protein
MTVLVAGLLMVVATVGYLLVTRVLAWADEPTVAERKRAVFGNFKPWEDA